jgi:hypothetical protein
MVTNIHNRLPEEEEMEVAALLLQKLIRGRISQNMMYQGTCNPPLCIGKSVFNVRKQERNDVCNLLTSFVHVKL